MMKTFLRTTTAVTGILLLTQCSDYAIRVMDRPVQPLPKSLESVHPKEASYQRYRQAYQLITQARAMTPDSPDKAVGLYLEAAEISTKSNLEDLLPLYNHAVARAADLLVGNPQLSEVSGHTERYRIEYPKISRAASKRGEMNLLEFKDVIPSDSLKLKGWDKRVVSPGVGAPMVANYVPNAKLSSKEDTFVHTNGLQLPVTVVVDFPGKGAARFRAIDSTVNQKIRFLGEERTLAKDLTAPMAVSLDKARERGLIEDIRGVFYPVRYQKNMGLYSTQKFDERKIPLILIHGLVSDPTTWSVTLNGLLEDPEISSRYQVYLFYYPTGLPIRRTGSALKQELIRLQRFYNDMGAGDVASRSVIIGHSMGGLLTSMQVRKFGDATWKRISNIPLTKSKLRKEVKADYTVLLETPFPSMLNRAVFIATPHRGSQMANGWIGRIVISLIQIPEKVLKLDPVDAARSLTALGRTILLDDDLSNGVRSLRNNNPALGLIRSSPIVSSIPYHSIIGDRGRGDTPDSSDGVVAYRSSHLEGAKSEVIVPSGHSAHANPKAIQELRRILHANLSRR
ncbi:hypothetical protein NT6N_23220 [Oceaniferula spumae]|uniref:AB hydrolase-1 domain-containing protein n=1 Tax=Oceaniferula spumae TaxID=2979115 RepID=A0AAT9FME1_9BACT